MAQAEILGPERRRSWSEEEKRAIIAAAFAPGAVVKQVARQADVSTGLLYRWRKQLRDTAQGFAEVVVSAGSSPSDSLASAIEVRLRDGATVHIPASSRPDLAAAVLKALVHR
jgi:transposase